MKQTTVVALLVGLLGAQVVAGAVGAAPSSGNEAPLVEAGLDQSVDRGAVVLLDAGGTRDPDGRVVDYQWSIEAPDGSAVAPACPTCERTTFRASQRGTYAVALTATDDDGATGSDTLYVRVGTDNGTDGPTVRLRGPRSTTVGDRERYTAHLTPGDARVVTVRWSVDGTRVATESVGANQQRVQLSRRFSSTGQRTVTVEVVDEDGRTASDSLRVTVESVGGGRDVAPVVDITGPGEVVAGESASYRARASDRDGSIVDYDWSTSTDGAVGGYRSISKTFRGNVGDTVTISVRVRDDDGNVARDELTVDLVGRGAERNCDLQGSITGPRFVNQRESAQFRISSNRQLVQVGWRPSDGRTLNTRGTVFQRTFDEAVGETVEITAEIRSGGCSQRATHTVRVASDTTNRSTNRDIEPDIINDISHRVTVNKNTNDGDRGPSENARNHHWKLTISHKGGEDVNVIWRFSDGVIKTQTIRDLSQPRTVSIQRTVTYFTRNSTAPAKHTHIRVKTEIIDQTSDSILTDWSGIVYANPIVGGGSRGSMTISVSPGKRVSPGTSLEFNPNVRTAFAVRWGDGTQRREYPSTTNSVTYTYNQPGIYTAEFISNNGQAAQVGRATIHVLQENYDIYSYMIKLVERQETKSLVDPDVNEGDANDDWKRASKAGEKWNPTSNYRKYDQWDAPQRFYESRKWRKAGSERRTERVTRSVVSATSPGPGWSLYQRRVSKSVQQVGWSGPRIKEPKSVTVWKHRWIKSTYTITKVIKWQKYEKISDVFTWVKKDVRYEEEKALQKPEPGTFKLGSLTVETYSCKNKEAPLRDEACNRLKAG